MDNTVFMQQLRFFKRINRKVCLVKAFATDLSHFLQCSLQQGYELIVCLDVNENMKTGRIARAFQALDLIETMEMFYQGPE